MVGCWAPPMPRPVSSRAAGYYENAVSQAAMVGRGRIVTSSSRPGLSRPSPSAHAATDGPDEPGYDEEATAAPVFRHRGAGAAGWPALD